MKILTAIRYMLAIVLCLPGLAPAVERLTLRECMDTALKNQPSIRAAREGVAAGQGRAVQSASSYLPHVQASTGYSESHAPGGALGDSVTKSYTTTLSVNQVLYDFGKTGSAHDAALFGVRSSEYDAERIAQETILNVKQAYYGLLAATKLLQVAHKTVEQAEGHLRQAEAFFKAGTKPKYDVTRAEVEVNNAHLGLINSKNSVRLKTIALQNAMGIDPGKDMDIEDVLAEPAAVPALETALTEALAKKPEMCKINADIDAARARVKAEESNYYPTLSAAGAYNWARGTSEMGMFSGNLQDSWNAGVTLSMPLYEGGLTKGRTGEARANMRMLEAQAQGLRQAIIAEANQAYADIESAAARISVMESSLKKAEENLELAQGRYAAGVGPYMEVTDAQVASANAGADQVQALYDYQLSVARLYKAMGRMGN